MKNLFMALICLIYINGFCQKYDLGKVTIDELKVKNHPTDTSANAAVLFKIGQTYFDLDSEGYWFIVTEVKKKIKIYKREGYGHANVQIPFYTGGKLVRLNFDDAVTYNIVGDKIEKTKLKSDGEFTEAINENYSYKKIALPNVKEGCIIEYSYKLKTPYFTSFPDFHFQYEIPVNYSEYIVRIPQYFTYRKFMKGYANINQSKEIEVPSLSRRYSESKIVYSANDLKAIKDESFVTNIENYAAIVQYELASTNFPDSGIKNYATDWQSVAKTIYEDKDFGNELNYKSYFEKDLEPLLRTVSSRDEKINLIFNYVKSRMNWNEKNGYYCVEGIKKAYAQKVGNVAEINLMLTAMLRYAEIKANPILISTRANGIALFPNRTAYNYVIAGVELENNKYVLLDATSKNSRPNILPLRVLNWKGRMIRENKTSSEIDLMPEIVSKEIVNVIASLDNEGIITGKTRAQYFDYNNFVFREHYLKMSKDSYLEKIEKKYNGIEIDDYLTDNNDDVSKPIIENFNFKHSNMVEKIGDKIYFSPMLYYTKNENPFKDEVREYPVDFSYPYQDKFSFTISVPEGYIVESLPKPAIISMEQNIGTFKFNISSSGDKIQTVVSVDINFSSIASDYYETLKNFYKAMIEKQSEKVVLTKKT